MTLTALSSLTPTLPKVGQRHYWRKLPGSANAVLMARAAETNAGPLLIVTPDTPTALRLQPELQDLLPAQEVWVLPDWETLPYDQFSPHQDIISQRLETLYRLRQLTQGIVLVPINTLLLYTCPEDYLDQHTLLLEKGQKLDIQALRRRLEHAGYRSVNQVMEHGEYAARGAILDVFPMGSHSPLRIDLFDDEIDTLRRFDPNTQLSSDQLNEFKLLPAHEFPLDEQGIERFRGQWRAHFAVSNKRDSIYQQVSRGIASPGIEYYLPLFFEQLATVFDYLPEQAAVIQLGDIEQAAQRFLADVHARYEDRRYDENRPLLPPAELFLSTETLFSHLSHWPRWQMLTADAAPRAGLSSYPVEPLPNLEVNHQANNPLAALAEFANGFAGRLLVVVESEGRRETLLELLKPLKWSLPEVESVDDFLAGAMPRAICVSSLEQGFIITDPQIAVVAEANLFGQKVLQRRRRKQHNRTINNDAVIRNLAELTIGQPVVHIDHGVGRYAGLQTIDAGGMPTEFVTIEYAGGDKLYVPVASLHLIGRYTGGDIDHAPLNKLGNETWSKAKRKAAEKVRDVAAELLDVYAKRAAKPGQSITIDWPEYQKFAASFPFEETDDQLQAINATLSDMQAPTAMDRLVCGDVGFGKTEVAMRAAFVAVNAGKQVAVLVPTTLLAQQHYENFRDRFANWPIRVEVLSRFVSAKQTQQILSDLDEGKVDIVIGTHKLLQQSIKFEDLGLLIVDEEHRFGVRQKDKIKALRADVDILTLTATPIPRTLNMAMSGMRDLSIIATPPARRLAVKTFVRPFDLHLVREAVMREILRGGQVYYLHNDVATIEKAAADLAEKVPEAQISIAHGQMPERELERVMSDFYHQRFNVLVCSTIIETGIDIPSANTIVMARADLLGLAQLHQLRGRVGRSHHQAYAYLLTPPPKAMTKDAQKRLEAIEQLEDLGAGFALATHDLEIRGAGELLGDEQSGQIASVGFSLYMEMLEQAVAALRAGKEPSLDQLLGEQSEIELRLPALIPDDYIPDVNSRLSLYKRIASAANAEELRELQVEMIDRFGLLPEPVKNLFDVTAFKQHAQQLGIRKLELGAGGGYIDFTEEPKIDTNAMIALIQEQPAYYRLEGSNRLRLLQKFESAEDRKKAVTQLLATLGAPVPEQATA